jgi:Alr-MurF fusion protein
MSEINLKDLAKITHGDLVGEPSQTIRFLETDSRRINFSPDTLFIAIAGIRHDGHRYIPELIAKGFKNFLINKGAIDRRTCEQGNFILVTNTLQALQLIAGYARRQIKGPLIAITGSNGKTVVKEWLFHCLSQQNIVSRSPRSYNSQIGVPLSLWLLNPQSDWSIIEAGISKPGEMEKLETMICADIGIITNIGQAHQENFDTLNQKINEKLILFRRTKKVFYCLDHSLIHDAIKANDTFRNKELITWSMKDHSADLYIEEAKSEKNDGFVLIHYKEEIHRLKLPFTDKASVENCGHIISFLLHFQFVANQIQQAISTLSPVAMRLEQVKGTKGCTLINDTYNSDINSLRIALDFLSLQIQHKKRSIILSELRQTGLSDQELYNEIFRLLSSYEIDQMIFVGENISSFPKLPVKAKTFLTTDELLEEITEIILADSAVLIKGAREFEFEKITNILSEKKHTTVLEINLNHLVHNLNYFRSLLQSETKIMVMVKALSYGSGSYEIANLLQHEKVDYLGVAFTDEGIELREKGITLPVMVMSPDPESFGKIIEYNLEPEIFNFSGLLEFSQCVSANQLPEYPVHIKIDTGMHRLGFLPEEMHELIPQLSMLNNIRVKSIFSHLAASDKSEEDAFTKLQIERFNKVIKQFKKVLGYTPLKHLVNSAGIERFPQAHFDMVRLGIGLHGISCKQKKLKAVSTLKSSIAQIKDLVKGETVGYNRREVLSRDSKIAIIPVGYADGLDRKLGNRTGSVLVNKQKVPYIGDICMDLCMIDITGMSAKEGDEVRLFGAGIPIQTLAEQVDTIPYEILTNVSSRVKRIYINE